MNKRRFSFLVVLVVLTLACSCFNTQSLGNILPVATQPASGPQILFQDDFSNPNSGWASAGYTNGAFMITVDQANTDTIDTPGQQFPADVAIEVEATKIGGPNNNNFGVVCRYQDSNNHYFLQIASDGYATIGMYKDGTITYLLANPWDQASAVNTGNIGNQIRAVCQGSTLTLYANGTQVAQVTDSTFTSGGEVGLIAGTFGEAGTSIWFDNFVVSAP